MHLTSVGIVKIMGVNLDKFDTTPSPAQYNVSILNTTHGGKISKTGRFAEFQSPVSSDKSSYASTTLQTIFRTPNPPRKGKCLFAQKLPSDQAETLKEKIVECNNKDIYIKELIEQLEEMKQHQSDLRNEIILLSKVNCTLECTISDLKERHGADKNTLEIYKKEVELIKTELIRLNEAFREIIRVYNVIKFEYKDKYKTLIYTVEELKDLYRDLQADYNSLLSEKEEIQLTLESKINVLKMNHQKEIQMLETNMIQTTTHMQNLSDLQILNAEMRLNEYKQCKEEEVLKLESKNQSLYDDFEAKIKQLEENHKEALILSDILMKEKHEDLERGWKLKFEEVERRSLQNEAEKNKILFELAQQKKKFDEIRNIHVQMKTDYDYLQNEHKKLRADLSKIIIELNTTRETNFKELRQREANVNQAIREKYLYEITIQKTHKTVEALKRRLMKSDHDVEQLKAELEATEESKLEVEGKCNRLIDELETVTGLCDVVFKEEEDKILSLQQELLSKVDFFRMQADEKIKSTLQELDRTKIDLTDTKKLLYEQQLLNTEAQNCLAVCESEIDRLELLVQEYSSKSFEVSYNNNEEQLIQQLSQSGLSDENSKLKTVIEFMKASEDDLLKQIIDLKQKLNQKVELLNQTKITEKMYIELEEKFNVTVEKLESENMQLRKTVSEQNALIGPFRSQLQDYEREYEKVLNEKSNIEKDAKELGLKYAEILGHQNKKQKIKYMVDLKKQNFQLSDDKKQLEIKIRSQARMIEKLKLELHTPKKLSKKDKENVCNGSLNSSRMDSPGPLKDLN
ncbi:hypothetical protein FQR65_LT02740 [Abscondita terminalis]|nr:hypothetical protein FQR65_LT02740 [Abscondita terminalis]